MLKDCQRRVRHKYKKAPLRAEQIPVLGFVLLVWVVGLVILGGSLAAPGCKLKAYNQLVDKLQ